MVRLKEGEGLCCQVFPRPDWHKGASHVQWGENVLAEGTVIQRPSEHSVSADQEGPCGRNTASKADEWPQIKPERRQETDDAWA